MRRWPFRRRKPSREEAPARPALRSRRGAIECPCALLDVPRVKNISHVGAGFGAVACQTGRTLVRNLRHKKVDQIRALIAQLGRAPSRLSVIGQAAVLAAKDGPGVVRAVMKGDALLVITIEECPECLGLRRDAPFCFLNQGIITEFAARYLEARVRTQE